MSNLEKLDRGEAMIAIAGNKYECVDIRLNMEVQKTALLCLKRSTNNNKGDWEVIHREADEVLLSALRSLGMNELVDAFDFGRYDMIRDALHAVGGEIELEFVLREGCQ